MTTPGTIVRNSWRSPVSGTSLSSYETPLSRNPLEQRRPLLNAVDAWCDVIDTGEAGIAGETATVRIAAQGR
jgi:hypothetical protein